MLKALIFDVDGTLAETEELHRRAFNEIFTEARLGWHWSVDQYRALLRTTGGKERMAQYRRTFGAAGPDDATIAALHAAKTRRYGQLLRQGAIRLRPGVRALMQQARTSGLLLGVATTTSRRNVDGLSRACWDADAGDVFDAVAAGDEVSAKKPAPDVYELALKRLGLSPDEALAIEDSRNGLLSAKAAGIRVVVTPSAYTEHENLSDADILLQDLTAFPAQALLPSAGSAESRSCAGGELSSRV